VVEEGSHSQLLVNKGSRYAAMWRKQLEDDKAPGAETTASKPSLASQSVILEMDEADSHSSGSCGCH